MELRKDPGMDLYAYYMWEIQIGRDQDKDDSSSDPTYDYTHLGQLCMGSIQVTISEDDGYLRGLGNNGKNPANKDTHIVRLFYKGIYDPDITDDVLANFLTNNHEAIHDRIALARRCGADRVSTPQPCLVVPVSIWDTIPNHTLVDEVVDQPTMQLFFDISK